MLPIVANCLTVPLLPIVGDCCDCWRLLGVSFPRLLVIVGDYFNPIVAFVGAGCGRLLAIVPFLTVPLLPIVGDCSVCSVLDCPTDG